MDALNDLNWFRKNPHISVVSERVPDVIIRGCILHNVKVKRGKNGFGDDEIYNQYPEIRRMLPRGCTIFQKGETYFYASKGFKKFVDYDEEAIEPYFSDSIDKTEALIVTEKKNGEAGFISSAEIDGEMFWFAGSKNVKMLLRNENDIALYTDDKYRYAKTVAEAFFENCHPDLMVFLNAHRLTAVCELLNPKTEHIVSLSYLSKPELIFISLIEMDSNQCWNPVNAIQMMQSFGLKTVDYRTMPYHSLSILQFKKDLIEGYVIYYCVGYRVIGMVKVKTSWYIFARSTREIFRKNLSLKQKLEKMRERMKTMEHLCVDASTISKLTEWGCGFITYLHGLHQPDIDRYGTHLATYELHDELCEIIKNAPLIEPVKKLPVSGNLVAIVGPIGYGKSWEGNYLESKLPNSVHIDFDTLDLGTNQALHLHGERNLYTGWLVNRELLRGKTVIVSAGGGMLTDKSLKTFKYKFTLLCPKDLSCYEDKAAFDRVYAERKWPMEKYNALWKLSRTNKKFVDILSQSCDSKFTYSRDDDSSERDVLCASLQSMIPDRVIPPIDDNSPVAIDQYRTLVRISTDVFYHITRHYGFKIIELRDLKRDYGSLKLTTQRVKCHGYVFLVIDKNDIVEHNLPENAHVTISVPSKGKPGMVSSLVNHPDCELLGQETVTFVSDFVKFA